MGKMFHSPEVSPSGRVRGYSHDLHVKIYEERAQESLPKDHKNFEHVPADEVELKHHPHGEEKKK